MDLHLNYESVEPYPLQHVDVVGATRRGQTDSSSAGDTQQNGTRESVEGSPLRMLRGVPAEAWEYRLGTYSALEWILERYKEKKPKDPTIAEKFNTYRFADYKEKVIDLLQRVTTVSAETMKIVKEMSE